MKVIRRKVHEYLGMNLDYSVNGQFKIRMLDYINEILECLHKVEPKSIGTKSCESPLNLFVVDEDSYKTSKEKLETFRKLIEKMLFATKRSWPYTCTDIYYLTTRVRDPYQSD